MQQSQCYTLPPKEKVKIIDDILTHTYGNPEWVSRLDPVSELILTILSQHTSDKNSGAAFDRLYDHFNGDWKRVMEAPTEEVAQLIKSAGLSNIKAPRIQSVLKEIWSRLGSFDLQFLKDMPINAAKEWLTSINGVGPKTAACVLMFSLGLPVMPVDTHVHRVSLRLGLIPPKTNADRAHDILAQIVSPERAYPFHINLIRHGRRVCKAPVPKCNICPLTCLCVYFHQNNLSIREGK